MKINPRQNSARGFSLIELMTVITIILILAGLVVGGTSYIQKKQAIEKTKVQIKLLEKGCEEYQLDHGYYPLMSGGGTSVNQRYSNVLYDALYAKGANPSSGERIYVAELNSPKMMWISGTTIIDPWKYEYFYRSAKYGTPTKQNNYKYGKNPDFDIWSSGPDGKSDILNTQADVCKDDIGNF